MVDDPAGDGRSSWGRSTPLVGREPEMHELRSCLSAAEAGRGRLVLVGGDAGIGKTRLVEELAAHVRDQGRPVLWGRAAEADGAPAFWPWVQVLRECAEIAADPTAVDEIADVLAGLESESVDPTGRPSLRDEFVDARSARFRLFDRTARALRNCAADGAVVVILDDLHWADPPSLALVEFLSPMLWNSCQLVVATYRDDGLQPEHPLTGVLGEAARTPHNGHLTLPGLGAREVERYIDLVAGTPVPGGLATRVHAETDGNPFFVTEVVRLLCARGALTDVGTGRTVLPPTVRATVRRRLDRLSTGATAVLDLAAVLGREFSLPLLERAAGAVPGTIDDRLAEATDASIVTRVSDDAARYRFVHALVRETVYDGLSTAGRGRGHRLVAGALEEVYGPGGGSHAAELVHHLLHALPEGDPAVAVDAACAAAEETARKLAHEEAVRIYRLALECLDRYRPEDTPRRCRAMIGLGRAARRADEADAAATLREAARLAASIDEPELLARAALALGEAWPVMGVVDRGLLALLEQAADRAGPTLRSRLLARLAVELYFSDAHERRVTVSEEALRLAVASGDAVAEAQALVARHWALYGPDHLDERLRIAARMVRLGEETGEDELTLQGRHWRVVDLLDAGAVQDADVEIAAYADLAERLADPFARWQTHLRRALRALLDGRFDEAATLTREAYEMGRRQDPRTAAGYYLTQRFGVCRERCLLTDVEEEVAGFVAANPAIPGVGAVLAVVYAETGRPRAARRLLARWSADGFAALPRDYTWLGMIVLYAEVCVDVADRRTAATVLTVLRPYADRAALVGRPSLSLGSVARPLGMLATTLGRYDEAERYFEQALSANTRMGATPFVAYTEAAYAAMLVTRDGAGDLDRAAALRARAAATAAELDMPRLTARLRAPHLPAPAGLSAREVEVLRLLGTGRSNREIAEDLTITLNTVLSHVRHIFTKTGVANRTEAAQFAGRHGLLTQDHSLL